MRPAPSQRCERHPNHVPKRRTRSCCNCLSAVRITTPQPHLHRSSPWPSFFESQMRSRVWGVSGDLCSTRGHLVENPCDCVAPIPHHLAARRRRRTEQATEHAGLFRPYDGSAEDARRPEITGRIRAPWKTPTAPVRLRRTRHAHPSRDRIVSRWSPYLSRHR